MSPSIPRHRVAAILRAAVAWVLMWRAVPWVVFPVIHFILGTRLPRMADHVLIASAVIRSEMSMILSICIAASLVILSEPGGLSVARLFERSNLPGSLQACRPFPLGLVTGCLAMCAIIGAMAATGHAHIVPQTAPRSRILTTFLEFSVAYLLVGVAEELQNRGYVLRAMSDGIGFWAAALITSIWFMSVHLIGGDPWFGALGTGMRGFFFCLTWRATGSLAFAIGFHAAWDWTETALFGVPDSTYTVPAAVLTTRLSGPVWLSGGIVGPEGSVFAYVATILLIAVALGRKGPRPLNPAGREGVEGPA